MRTYIVYLMERIGMFDPWTDFLLASYKFLTWREVDQFAPPGLPYALVKMPGNWLVGGPSVEALGKSYFSAEEDRAIHLWLNQQRHGRDSLGPHHHGDEDGMFGDIDNHSPFLFDKLLGYNILVTDDKNVVAPESVIESRFGPLKFGEDSQILEWCQYSREFNYKPKGFWEFVRPQLLEKYKQIQDNRLGLTREEEG